MLTPKGSTCHCHGKNRHHHALQGNHNGRYSLSIFHEGANVKKELLQANRIIEKVACPLFFSTRSMSELF